MGRDADDRRARSDKGYAGGTLDDPSNQFYKPPYQTGYDAFGNPIGRYANPFASSGGGGGGSPFGGDDAAAGATGASGTAAGTTAATGGALSGWLRLAGTLAPILGNLAGGRAQGRSDAAAMNQAQARAQADIFRTRMAAALEGPRRSAQDAAYGDTLANVQPFKFTGSTHQVGNIPVPDASGGMGPQNFGPMTRQAGQDLARTGASRVTSPSFAIPEPPELAPLPEASAADSWLNGGSTIAALLAAYGLNRPQGQRNTTGTPLPRSTYYDPSDTNGYG